MVNSSLPYIVRLLIYLTGTNHTDSTSPAAACIYFVPPTPSGLSSRRYARRKSAVEYGANCLVVLSISRFRCAGHCILNPYIALLSPRASHLEYHWSFILHAGSYMEAWPSVPRAETQTLAEWRQGHPSTPPAEPSKLVISNVRDTNRRPEIGVGRLFQEAKGVRLFLYNPVTPLLVSRLPGT